MASTTAQFAFSIGEKVRLPTGEVGIVSGLLTTASGNQVRVQIGFDSEFVNEDSVQADDSRQ